MMIKEYRIEALVYRKDPRVAHTWVLTIRALDELLARRNALEAVWERSSWVSEFTHVEVLQL